VLWLPQTTADSRDKPENDDEWPAGFRRPAVRISLCCGESNRKPPKTKKSGLRGLRGGPWVNHIELADLGPLHFLLLIF